jgi:uncharacterized protein related to proFAR isomerase
MERDVPLELLDLGLVGVTKGHARQTVHQVREVTC